MQFGDVIVTLLQEAKYSAVQVDVKCADGKELPRPAKNTTSPQVRPLITDGEADEVLRYAITHTLVLVQLIFLASLSFLMI